VEGLAASTVVLFFLVLPGILLREGYKSSGLGSIGSRFKLSSAGSVQRINRPEDYPKNRRPLVEEIFQSLFWTVILHTGWISIAGWMFGQIVDLPLVGRFAFGKPEAADFAQVADQFPRILLYFLTLYVASFWFGFAYIYVVRWSKSDLDIPFFRLRDQWFYLLRGDFANFGERLLGRSRRNIVATACTVGFEDATGSFTYSGILADYVFDSDGALEYVVLDSATRVLIPPPGDNAFPQKGPMDAEIAVVSVKGSKYLLLSYIEIEPTAVPAAAPASSAPPVLTAASDPADKG